jgi:hypothetical protein
VPNSYLSITYNSVFCFSLTYFILSCQFAEAMFSGTWWTHLIGLDAFSETGHVICAVYLWADLQMHIILQGCIELDVISHPEGSSIVVEYLI